jgi:hypothetical protein
MLCTGPVNQGPAAFRGFLPANYVITLPIYTYFYVHFKPCSALHTFGAWTR